MVVADAATPPATDLNGRLAAAERDIRVLSGQVSTLQQKLQIAQHSLSQTAQAFSMLDSASGPVPVAAALTPPASVTKAPAAATKKSAPVKPAKKAAAPKTEKIPSALISLGMFQQGQTIEAIARERKLAPGTVEGHLVDCIGKGLMELEQYLSSEASGNILACMDSHPGKTIQEWVTLLNGLYSYNQVKAVQAYRKRQQDAAVI